MLVRDSGHGHGSRATDEIVESDEIFKSRGKEFAVDVFAPRAPGKYPAIIALHGHGGPGEDKRLFARPGPASAAPRLRRAGAPLFRPSQAGSQEWPKKRPALLRLDADGQRCDQLRRAGPDVDRRRVGLASASLGSWVSVSVAARDRRVSAVVEYYGGLPEWEELDLTRLPPVLILHGDADRNVRVEEAYKLEQVLRASGVSYEMHIYVGAGHGFRGEDRDDAIKRTLDFFESHVKRAH